MLIYSSFSLLNIQLQTPYAGLSVIWIWLTAHCFPLHPVFVYFIWAMDSCWVQVQTAHHMIHFFLFLYIHWHLLLSFSSVTQSCPTLCDPWTTARQASLSITNSQSLLKLMSIESVMPSNHLILCCPFLLFPSIFPASGSVPVSQFFASGG